MNNDLINILKNYGFSEKEAKVYLSILEIGNTIVSVIARRSGVKRVTVYTILDELKKRGIANETIKNEIKYYSVITPDKIFKDFEKKCREFKNNLPSFLSIAGKYGDRPRMQFFDGSDKVNEMLYEYSDIWVKSIQQYDTTRRGYQDHEFVEQYLERLKRYRNKQVPNEKIYLFSNNSKLELKIGKKLQKSNNRIIKKTPKGFEFTNTTRILGDYIIMIYHKDGKHYAFQIQDKELARNLREVFKILWGVIK